MIARLEGEAQPNLGEPPQTPAVLQDVDRSQGTVMKTICLVMIVKNESAVIRRCLDSVKSTISHWVICDTGSSDDTKQIIEETLRGIPGTFYEDEWTHFGHNRSLAISRAK